MCSHPIGIDIPFDAQFVPSWPGYIVTGREYVLVAFESLDEDFKTRRPGPAAFRSSGGFLDISNGPHGYQLCDGYPCNYRVATYYALCVVGKVQLDNRRMHCYIFYTPY